MVADVKVRKAENEGKGENSEMRTEWNSDESGRLMRPFGERKEGKRKRKRR